MTVVKTHLRVAPDGTLSGRAAGLPPGEHEAEITLLDAGAKQRRDPAALLAQVRAIQAEIARMPVLDDRTPDEIVGYDKLGHFD